MIYCPNCGAANRKGSRFCNECGERLPSTGIRCPMCGTTNPVGNIYCQECNARLVPKRANSPEEGEEDKEQAPIQGVSFPSIPLEEEETGEEEQKGEPESEQQQAPDIATSGEDWLSQLRSTAEEEPQEPEPVEEPVEDEEPFEIQDRLGSIGVIDEEATQQEEAPAPEEEPSEKKAPSEPTPRSTEVSDWLEDFASLEKEPSEGPPAVDEAPPRETPSEEKPEPPAQGPTVGEPIDEDEAPPWLQDIEGKEETPQEAAPEEPTPAPEAADVPDWLRDVEPAEAEKPAEAAPAPGEPSPPSKTPGEAEEMPPEGEAPPQAPEEAEPTPAPEAADIPGWLRDVEPAEAEKPTEAAPASGEPSPPSKTPGEAEEMPPEGEAPPQAPEEAEPTPAPEAADIPDWLRDAAPSETEAPQIAGEPAAQAEAPVEETEPSSQPPPFTEEPVPADVPDWAAELEGGAEEPAAQAEAPAEEAEPPSQPPPFTEKPVPADIPDWIAELEGETEEAAPLEPGEEAAEPVVGPAESPEGLARAEIPGWLEGLRPQAEAEEVTEKLPAETEGLLKGLRGVLSPDLPVEATPPEGKPSAEPSEASLTRAQLLQSLLAQPAEKPERRARERGLNVGEVAQRWLIALVLTAAVLGVLVAPWIRGLDIPPLTGSGSSQTIEPLNQAIERVNEGDLVLVAFEYGTAEADELDLVAKPILQRLLDRGARIDPVSTQVEGAVMAERLLDEIVTSGDRYTETQYSPPRYRAGGATGVSQLLNATEPRPALLLVLTARPTPLRRWIEQTHAETGDELPTIAGLSAALEPVARPYLEANAGQLEGALHGLSEAAEYEPAGDAANRLNALAAGHIAIIGLMVIGALIHAISGPDRRGRR